MTHYSIKWKKRLSKMLLFHWNAPPPTSATAMAAATEKFARKDQHYHIHSEDLTASQFANLTGIKTKRNSHNTTTSAHSIYYDYVDSEVDSEDEEDDCPIWDSKFWHIEKPLTRVQSEPTIAKPIIQKGRFQIIWGEEEQQQMTKSSSSYCVEWKRKRVSAQTV